MNPCKVGLHKNGSGEWGEVTLCRLGVFVLLCIFLFLQVGGCRLGRYNQGAVAH